MNADEGFIEAEDRDIGRKEQGKHMHSFKTNIQFKI
jgi:hypothetical protein